MAERITGRSSEQFVVRLPAGMRDQIAEAAKSASRSMNAEIVQRLAQSFDLRSENPTAEIAMLNLREAVSMMQLALRQYQKLLGEDAEIEAQRSPDEVL